MRRPTVCRGWARALAGCVLAVCAAAAASPAAAQGSPADFEAAKALGNATKDPIVNGIKDATGAGAEAQLRATVPGYTANPPQTSYYGQSDLGTPAATQQAACAANPDDTACAAANLGVAPRTYPPVPPDALSASAAINDPFTVLPPLSSTYSACTSRTETVSQPTYDTQTCNDYPLRSVDNACTKTLQVNVDWQCNDPRTINGPFRDASHAPPWRCELQDSYWEWTCPAGTTGPPAWFPDRSGYYCGPDSSYPRATFVADGPYWTCPDGPDGASIIVDPASLWRSLPAGHYCSAGGVTETPADWTEFPYTFFEDATPLVTDTWINPCADHEALVPPGALPPDGVNPEDGTIGAVASVNKCYRTDSTCTDPPATRTINDLEVTRTCWGYTNTFDCVHNDPRSDCSQPRFGACIQNGPPSCVEYDNDTVPPTCVHTVTSFTCQNTSTTTQTVQDCGTQTFTADGLSFDTSYPPDTDFARTVTLLEASREAGKYFDPNTLEIFKGFDNRCTKKLFGLVNCCNRSGSGLGGLLSNLSLALGSVGTVGRAAFSTYTYDALFTSQAPDLALRGFEFLADTGYSSALAGLATGNLSVGQFVTSLVPSYWTVAMLAIQVAGMLASCNENEQTVAMKRDERLCVPLGDYCSRCIRVFRRCVRCVEKTQSYCCFNSRLARIINEQGRPQIGKGWGSAQSPNCSGFTPAQLEQLDFAAMDLSEFYAEIAPTLPDVSGLQSGATTKAPSCYLGEGRC